MRRLYVVTISLCKGPTTLCSLRRCMFSNGFMSYDCDVSAVTVRIFRFLIVSSEGNAFNAYHSPDEAY